MQIDNNQEKAIQLITVNQNGKYVLTSQGTSFLTNIPSPIAVVSVAGMYRTGKSYLLNRMLLNRSDGFGVGPTVNPCTKGLWCWGKTIPGKTTDGQPVNVIIIDTQGIGALDEDQTHDTRIFTLAILAASSFIYNSTGSIDENALQNLSLVVNLTKNIQLNAIQSQDGQEGDDPQELADYFPSFYWVVRDFSLQLINTEGDTITPKQYLQRALAPQKGFSDDIEEKNRIRRLLSTFFKERECFTLVRPLVDQNKLQHLQKLELDELRPQFVEQAMNFRKRVLNRIKPKLLRGKQLNGQMYVCLLNSYVSSINNGAVPNIQNAWNYMCQEQCAKAFQQSLSTFNQEYSTTLKNNLPIEQQYLLDVLHELKDKACEQFQKKAVGDQVKFHLKQLREKFEQKIQNIKNDNEKQSEIILKNYFKKHIGEIENKLKVRDYDRFQEFTKDVNAFYMNILQCGPNLPRKQLVYLQLIKRIVPMAAQIFIKQKSQQIQKIKTLSIQKENNYQKTQQKLKNELYQQSQANKQKLMKLDRQLIELNLQKEQYKQIQQQTEKEFRQKEENYQKIIKSIQEDMRHQTQKYENIINKMQDNLNQMENLRSVDKCEQEKKNAVLQMQISQLQINLEQAKKKQSTLELTLKNIQITSSQQVKEIAEKYQYELKNKQLIVANLNQSINQYEESKSLLETELLNLKNSTAINIQTLKQQNEKKQQILQQKIQNLEEQLNTNCGQNSQKIEVLSKQLESKRNRELFLQKQNKALQEEHTNKQNKYKTELAVLEQKIQFITVENSEYINEISKLKKVYEDLVEEDKSRKLEENCRLENEKISEITAKYQSQIREMQAEHEAILKKITTQLQQTKKNNIDKQLQLKLLKTNYQAVAADKKRLQEQYEQKYQRLSQQQTQSNDTIMQQYKIKEEKYLEKIAQLEQQVQQTKQMMIKEQSDQYEKSQESVMQLKNYYELEKQRLENKIVSEKQKYERKIAILKDQHEQKMQEQVSQLEQDNQRLQQAVLQLEQQLNKEKSLRKMDSDIKNKSIENLQKSVQDFRSKLEQKQNQLTQKMQKALKDHQIQKQSLYTKIEELITAHSKIQKQKINLNHNREQLDKIIIQKDTEIKDNKQEITILKAKIEKQREQSKNMKNQINAKRNEERVELEKKVALLEQENNYIKKKIEESEKNHGSEQEINEEKLKRIKEQFNQQLKAHKQKLALQLENNEKKYEKLKKSSKQTESVQNKTISQLEKQLAISKQRNSNITEKLANIEEKNGQQIQQYVSQLALLKSTHQKEKQELKEMFDKELQERQKIQSEKNSMQASYQQDKILWENKNKFLEEGRERYKSEYENTKSQLQATIEKNRKKWSSEKMAAETAHNEQISKLEKKFWNEKQEIVENYKKSESESESKIKSLEHQLRTLQQKIAIQQQSKQGQQNISQKRLKQLVQNEKKLQNQVEKLKASRQKQQKQQLKNFQKQKQNLKQKYLEKQQKLKTSQKQRQHLFYQIQKQRAKWGIEKDTIVNKIEQQKQVIIKNEKDIEKLQRENQKLKVEKKCHKNSMQSVGKYGNGFTFGDRVSSSRSSLQDSILKENNNSQISDTSIFFKQ